MASLEALKENLAKWLCLSDPAVSWLLSVYDAFQFFDDVVDLDKIDRNDFNKFLYFCMVGQYQNIFFMQNAYNLLPLMANVILRWQGSDQMERDGIADERSFMWRAGFYDLVLQAVYIEHGHEAATAVAGKVAQLYGEKYLDYQEEFNHA